MKLPPIKIASCVRVPTSGAACGATLEMVKSLRMQMLAAMQAHSKAV